MRQISTSNGCRSFSSVESGFRPKATEISLLAPPNFPLGEDQVSSTMSLVLILRIERLFEQELRRGRGGFRRSRCGGGQRGSGPDSVLVSERHQSLSELRRLVARTKSPDLLNRELVATFVEWMASVALEPLPRDFVIRDKAV